MNNCENIYGITSEEILESVRIIMEVQEYYKKLIDMAPDAEQTDIIDTIISHNEYSLLLLKNLYFRITCNEPKLLPVYCPQIQSYFEGLMKAKAIELRNLTYLLKLWRNAIDVYFTNEIGSIRTVFGIPSNNSYLHATNLQNIMILYACKKGHI